MLIFLLRIKAPQHNAHAVGIRARQQAKLGSILDQVHSDLIKDKTKGESPQSRDNKRTHRLFHAFQIACTILSLNYMTWIRGYKI